jgi:hypothetical protein
VCAGAHDQLTESRPSLIGKQSLPWLRSLSFVSAEKATIGLVDAIFTRLHSREAVGPPPEQDTLPALLHTLELPPAWH